MYDFINSSFSIGSLVFANRLIQGPLAGFSCAPFRELFYQFRPPAYCVSEMISAQDVVHKHKLDSRYLHRSITEDLLCYQIAGTDPGIMAEAALRLESLGADLIDINCGCPKTKIRKKGAGSALLEKPELLLAIIEAVRKTIRIPLSVKLRIQNNDSDIHLAKNLENAGADALIIHGRAWTEDYDIPTNLSQIGKIKQQVSIPVIANGDISEQSSLEEALNKTQCDAFMISRSGTGKPWLYQSLLDKREFRTDMEEQKALFLQHLLGLASLEGEFKAVLQSKSLIRYYFRQQLDSKQMQEFYKLDQLSAIEFFLNSILSF
ncbi:putative tRNA-dihydrouridine synthase [Legionella massiliensis]|uniref:tRNA-dihydrouridine synthase n=1 Tax=Legionella massiliensis TaxID=1034943 RepID=A0A078KWF4_9GAMM|nr:tRNA-dihydrouridine synthase family protein [Legionella massiliensis]CDZ76008.1 putative tRNA-dihydrouridine synthase [Legionella massiliensis]CEE11746.1 tRNA-dihydrouridine synthase C [Legionella massiliensis]